jgi:2-dehydro-3-deoxygluconokinase
VIYDRKGAAIRRLNADEVDWGYFQSARNFYFSGITLALGKPLERILLTAVRRATESGMKVFFDLNHRRTLWPVRRARNLLAELLPSVNVFFAKAQDIESVFGLSGPLEDVAKQLRDTYRAGLVVITNGENGAMAWDGRAHWCAPKFATRLVNRFGMGDSFVAGFMYGFLRNGVDHGLRCGCGMAALKATIMNENYPLVTEAELEALLAATSRGEGNHSPSDVLR